EVVDEAAGHRRGHRPRIFAATCALLSFPARRGGRTGGTGTGRGAEGGQQPRGQNDGGQLPVAFDGQALQFLLGDWGRSFLLLEAREQFGFDPLRVNGLYVVGTEPGESLIVHDHQRTRRFRGRTIDLQQLGRSDRPGDWCLPAYAGDDELGGDRIEGRLHDVPCLEARNPADAVAAGDV